jgi:hypothetical protein
MHCRTHSKHETKYLDCDSKTKPGYPCGQKTVREELLEMQLLEALAWLRPNPNWRTHMKEAVARILGERSADERIAGIHAVIGKMDERSHKHCG